MQKLHAAKTRNIWRRRVISRCVAALKQQCPFFLIILSKDLLQGLFCPLCLGIMYCERRDPCITMGRGSFRCCSPSASSSKPHTSDSVYPASSTAIHFIDLHKKTCCMSRTFLNAMQIKKHKLQLLGMGCLQVHTKIEKSLSDKQANICHMKHCCSQSLMQCYSTELLLALAFPSYVQSIK